MAFRLSKILLTLVVASLAFLLFSSPPPAFAYCPHVEGTSCSGPCTPNPAEGVWNWCIHKDTCIWYYCDEGELVWKWQGSPYTGPCECGGVPPVTYRRCENMSCIETTNPNHPGAPCFVSSDCSYRTCSGTSCVTRAGSGRGDDCSRDTDCSRLVCEGSACIKKAGGATQPWETPCNYVTYPNPSDECSYLSCDSDSWACTRKVGSLPTHEVGCNTEQGTKSDECWHQGCDSNSSGQCIEIFNAYKAQGDTCDPNLVSESPSWDSRPDYHTQCSHLECSFLTCERVPDSNADVPDQCEAEYYFSDYCLKKETDKILNDPEDEGPLAEQCLPETGNKFDKDYQELCCGITTPVPSGGPISSTLKLVIQILNLFNISTDSGNDQNPDSPALLIKARIVPLKEMQTPNMDCDDQYLRRVSTTLASPLSTQNPPNLDDQNLVGDILLGRETQLKANSFTELGKTYQVKHEATNLANFLSTPLQTTLSPGEIEEMELVAAFDQGIQDGYQLACFADESKPVGLADLAPNPTPEPSSSKDSFIPQLATLTAELKNVFSQKDTPNQEAVLGVNTDNACPETIRSEQIPIACLEKAGDEATIELTSYVDIENLLNEAEGGTLVPEVAVPFLADNAIQLLGNQSIPEDSPVKDRRVYNQPGFYQASTQSPLSTAYESPARDADMGEFRFDLWIHLPNNFGEAVKQLMDTLDWFANADSEEQGEELGAALALLGSLKGHVGEGNKLTIIMPGTLAYSLAGFNKTLIEDVQPHYLSPLAAVRKDIDWDAPSARPDVPWDGGGVPPSDPPGGNLSTLLAAAEAATSVAAKIIGAVLAIESPTHYNDPSSTYCPVSLCGATGPMQITTGWERVDCTPDAGQTCTYSTCCSPYYCEEGVVKEEYRSWFNGWDSYADAGMNYCNLQDSLIVGARMLKAKGGGGSITLTDTESIVRAVMSYYGNRYNNSMTPAQNCHKDERHVRLGNRTYCEYVFHHAGLTI